MTQTHDTGWTGPYIVGATMLATLAAAGIVDLAALPAWWPPACAGIPAAILAAVAILRPAVRWRAGGLALWLAWCGSWSWWVVAHEWTQNAIGAFAFLSLGAAIACTALRRGDGEEASGRPRKISDVEPLLQKAANHTALEVVDIHPWKGRRRDGERIRVDLNGITLHALSLRCDDIAAALRLPIGCTVSVEEAEHQGAAYLDVMRRDCLAETRTVEESTEPASINDEFDVMHDPRGNPIPICLRLQSIILGGAPDMGKTTLLARIIMFLARCNDALVWVVDPGGGGVATPFIEPWAQGKATAPAVDWIAQDFYEGAVMVAVANAIVKDRKTSREAMRRRREYKTRTLPLDADLPAIVVIGDEGGEIGKATALLGALVKDGLSSLAQIGREAGGRAIMSVLRGTADLLDKGLRIVAAIRICLTMTEQDEYVHILGTNPPKTKLRHKGAGWIVAGIGQIPRLARSADVPTDVCEQHVIATARYRTVLDARAQQVAAAVTVQEVLGGRDPLQHLEIVRHRAFRDVAAGRAYSGRWDRYADKLAEMRDEEPPPPQEPPAPQPAVDQPTIAPAGSASEQLLIAAGMVNATETTRLDGINVEAEFSELVSDTHMRRSPSGEQQDGAGPPAPAEAEPADASGQVLTRDAIVEVLRSAYPEQLTSAQIGEDLGDMGIEVKRTYRQALLKDLLNKGRIARGDGDRYLYPAPDRS